MSNNNKEQEKKEGFPIRFIEESRRDVSGNATDFRTTILYKPKDDSLEIRKYQKRFIITDQEVLATNHIKLVAEMKKDAALQVFEKFYIDNFYANQ